MSAAEIDEGKLEAFMGQAVMDMGAIISAPLFVIGEKLGLYKAMAGAGPLSSQEVADRAGLPERNVRTAVWGRYSSVSRTTSVRMAWRNGWPTRL